MCVYCRMSLYTLAWNPNIQSSNLVTYNIGVNIKWDPFNDIPRANVLLSRLKEVHGVLNSEDVNSKGISSGIS